VFSFFVRLSGGKDSSAVIKLVLNAVIRFSGLSREMKIVYCDTGVENPVVSAFVTNTLHALSEELEAAGIRDCFRILRPEIEQRFFVRIIGRGYPPPTQFFRWCTKDLRIRPVQKYLRNLGQNALVIIGTRSGESAQRDRTLGSGFKTPFIRRQVDGGYFTYLYSPIVDFTLQDVWETLVEIPFPASIDVGKLVSIYRDGGGECPVVRETNDKPCSSARFGCWTCTVVRRDRSTEHMIEAGYAQLRPYYEFRRWLSEVRNDPKMRCKFRRNGSEGMGPFRLDARKAILERVKTLEREVGAQILTPDEEAEIKRLWRRDRASNSYRAMEAL
jgi:DNA sulfur modification protein DndC